MKPVFYMSILAILCPALLLSQSIIPSSTKKDPGSVSTQFGSGTELFPNGSYRSVLTPTGWGGYSTYVFGVLGGTFPQIYHDKPDLAAAVGLGTGNSYKKVGLVGMLNINDVSGVDNLSYSFVASKHIAKGSSISLGGLHLFRNHQKSDSKASYYVAYSHAVQSIPSKNAGFARLVYTIGAGSGRFYKKSEDDIQSGKGTNGTALFGNISYEIFKNGNLIVEWTGLNLGGAIAWRPSYKLPALVVGVADLTRNSGDKARLVLSIGHGVLITK